MKCKECKERIPDNVKYCPECGALINANAGKHYDSTNVEYNYEHGNRNGYSSDKFPHTPSVSHVPDNGQHFPSAPFNGRKTQKRYIPFAPLIVTLLIIFGFIAVASIAFSVFNRVENFEVTDAVPEYFDGFNIVDDVNNVALDYVNNIVDSDCMQSTDNFRMHSLIDWDLVFKDFFSNKPEYESLYQETVIDEDEDMYILAENNLQYGFDIINSRFTDDFIPFYFYTDAFNRTLLSHTEMLFYFDMLSAHFENLGLDVNDYYDDEQISKMFRVQIDVSAENAECDETQEFGVVEVILAEFYGEYYVLYDDVYIATLLESVK